MPDPEVPRSRSANLLDENSQVSGDDSVLGTHRHNIKAILRYCEGIDKPTLQPQFPMFFDLGSDPGERYNLFDRKLDMGWMFGVVLANVAEYKKSIAQYPNIEPGQDFDGYRPKGAGSG